jgi:hypothetical protein
MNTYEPSGWLQPGGTNCAVTLLPRRAAKPTEVVGLPPGWDRRANPATERTRDAYIERAAWCITNSR